MIIVRLARNSLLYTPFFNAAFVKQQVPRRFRNRQPKRPDLLSASDKLIEYNPLQALHLMRLHSFANFKESVEICVRLNVNPKIGDQVIRGTANLPAGLGKTVRVAVLCTQDEYDDLVKQGIQLDRHIQQKQLKTLDKNPVDFDKLYTTPNNLPKLKPFGKFLGPKGLMPNAKVGTLVSLKELPLALKQAKEGQVSYRVDKGKNIHAHIGKIDFTDEQLLVNWRAVMKSLVDKRPATLKGKYFTQAYLKSTMGPGWKINLLDIDPRQQRSIWGVLDQTA